MTQSKINQIKRKKPPPLDTESLNCRFLHSIYFMNNIMDAYYILFSLIIWETKSSIKIQNHPVFSIHVTEAKSKRSSQPTL